MFGFLQSKQTVVENPETRADFSLKTIFGPEFGLNDLELLETIGTGSFSRVRLVRHLGDNKYYALKMMKKSAIVRHGQLQHVVNEVFILSRIRSPLVVQLAGMFQDDNNVYICLEYASGGELFSHLRRKQYFTEQEAKFFTIETAAAIQAMHDQNVVYRDLRPENMCLSRDGHLRIVDFGFAKVVPEQTFTLCGTPEYLAPEIIEGKGYGMAVDWWALGILLHEMLYGYPPFHGYNPFMVYEKIMTGKENILFPPVPMTSLGAQGAMRNFLERKRKKRAGCGKGGFKSIKNLKFFSGVSWESASRLLLEPVLVPTVEMDGDTSNFDFYPEETSEEPSNLTAKQRALFAEFDVILSRPKTNL